MCDVYHDSDAWVSNSMSSEMCANTFIVDVLYFTFNNKMNLN